MSEFYDIKKLEEASPEALFYLVFGERSKGKSFSVCKELLERAYEKDGCFIIIRRIAEELKPSNASLYMDSLVEEGKVKEVTNGEYDRITYRTKKYYLAKRDPETDKIIKREKPVAHVVDLNNWINYKGNQYGNNIVGIIIEEYITYPQFYLPDEEQALLNMLSTILRNKAGIKIYALGNSVSKSFNPLHSLLGVTNIVKNMEQGTIKIVKVNEKLTVAIEHTAPGGEKPSDVYFVTGGNSNTADMISGKTAWETNSYPHITEDMEVYLKNNKVYTFYIELSDGDSTDALTLEVIQPDDVRPFIYVKKKYSELKYYEDDLVFTNKPKKYSPNIRRNILNPVDKIGQKILELLTTDNAVFYQTNEAGDILQSYILACKKM